MGEQPKLYVKVCTKCGRQVEPHVDHNLGASRTVYCDHGKKGPGSMGAASPWKRIEVVPVEPMDLDTASEQEQAAAGAAT